MDRSLGIDLSRVTAASVCDYRLGYQRAGRTHTNLPIGSLCILDIKPRRMTEREKRLLEVIGEDVMEEIKRRDSVAPPSAL